MHQESFCESVFRRDAKKCMHASRKCMHASKINFPSIICEFTDGRPPEVVMHARVTQRKHCHCGLLCGSRERSTGRSPGSWHRTTLPVNVDSEFFFVVSEVFFEKIFINTRENGARAHCGRRHDRNTVPTGTRLGRRTADAPPRPGPRVSGPHRPRY